MKISEVAEKVDVTPVTLRYYEQEGLIPPVKKKAEIRDYQEEDLGWIDFVLCMRKAGLSIKSLTHYTRLYQQGNETIEERMQLLVEERDQLAEKYQEIGESISRLNGKIKAYEQGEFYKE